MAGAANGKHTTVKRERERTLLKEIKWASGEVKELKQRRKELA